MYFYVYVYVSYVQVSGTRWVGTQKELKFDNQANTRQWQWRHQKTINVSLSKKFNCIMTDVETLLAL